MPQRQFLISLKISHKILLRKYSSYLNHASKGFKFAKQHNGTKELSKSDFDLSLDDATLMI